MASAVEGLVPEAVAIIDDSGRLLNRPRAGDGERQIAEANLDYRQQVESELLAKISAAPSNRCSATDQFRASVNVDCDFTSVDQSEEILRSHEIRHPDFADHGGIHAAAQLRGGTPGTASNLPSPAAQAAASARREWCAERRTSRTSPAAPCATR